MLWRMGDDSADPRALRSEPCDSLSIQTEAGMPLVMDADDPNWRKGNQNLGVRCNLIAAARPADTQVALRRDSLSQADGMDTHRLSISGEQYTPA